MGDFVTNLSNPTYNHVELITYFKNFMSLSDLTYHDRADILGLSISDKVYVVARAFNLKLGELRVSKHFTDENFCELKFAWIGDRTGAARQPDDHTGDIYRLTYK